MTKPPVVGADGLKHWTCDGCGRVSLWTPQHTAYSSLVDHDEGEFSRMAVTCSSACREHMGPNPLTRLGHPYRKADPGQPVGLPRVASKPAADFTLNRPRPRPGGAAA